MPTSNVDYIITTDYEFFVNVLYFLFYIAFPFTYSLYPLKSILLYVVSSSSNDVTVAEFFPSITTIWDPFAVPFVFEMLISPVEYITGDPVPYIIPLFFIFRFYFNI